MSKFFIAIKLLGVLTAWFTTAIADGKITGREAVELIEQIASMLGFDLTWDLSDLTDAPNVSAAKVIGAELRGETGRGGPPHGR